MNKISVKISTKKLCWKEKDNEHVFKIFTLIVNFYIVFKVADFRCNLKFKQLK